MDAPKLEATRRRFRIKIDDLIWHPAERGALYTNVYNTHKPARSSLRQAQRQARVPPAGSTPQALWVPGCHDLGEDRISNRLRMRRFKAIQLVAKRHSRNHRQQRKQRQQHQPSAGPDDRRRKRKRRRSARPHDRRHKRKRRPADRHQPTAPEPHRRAAQLPAQTMHAGQDNSQGAAPPQGRPEDAEVTCQPRRHNRKAPTAFPRPGVTSAGNCHSPTRRRQPAEVLLESAAGGKGQGRAGTPLLPAAPSPTRPPARPFNSHRTTARRMEELQARRQAQTPGRPERRGSSRFDAQPQIDHPRARPPKRQPQGQATATRRRRQPAASFRKAAGDDPKTPVRQSPHGVGDPAGAGQTRPPAEPHSRRRLRGRSTGTPPVFTSKYSLKTGGGKGPHRPGHRRPVTSSENRPGTNRRRQPTARLTTSRQRTPARAGRPRRPGAL